MPDYDAVPTSTVLADLWTLTGAATAHEALDEAYGSPDNDTTKVNTLSDNDALPLNLGMTALPETPASIDAAGIFTRIKYVNVGKDTPRVGNLVCRVRDTSNANLTGTVTFVGTTSWANYNAAPTITDATVSKWIDRRLYSLSAIQNTTLHVTVFKQVTTVTSATTVPDPPTNLSLTPGIQTNEPAMTMDWDAPADDGGAAITGYKIERKVTGGSYATLVEDTGSTATAYIDTTPVANTSYTYRVSAINSVGTSDPSNEDTQISVPHAPENLTATAVSSSQIDLAWNAPTEDGEAGPFTYRVFIETPIAGGFALHASGIETTSYSVTGLDSETEYNFHVVGYNGTGGPRSNEADATTLVLHVRSVSDSSGASDSVSRHADAFRIVASSLGMSSLAFDVFNTAFAIIIADLLGASDQQQRHADSLRSTQDVLGVSDDSLRHADAFRTTLDSLGISDQATRTASVFRLLSDAIGISDSRLFTIAFYRLFSDAIGAADETDTRKFIDRYLTDALGLSDDTEKYRVIHRLLMDVFGLSDTTQRHTDANRSLQDSLGQQDSAQRKADANRARSDTLGASDFERHLVAWGRGVSESVGFQDDAQRAAISSRIFSSALGISDDEAETMAWGRLANSTVGISDSAIHAEIWRRLVTDSMGSADAVFRVVAWGRLLSSIVGLADSAQHAQTWRRGLSDALSVSDTINRSATLYRGVSDDLGVSDQAQRAATLLRQFADILGISDVIGRVYSVFLPAVSFEIEAAISSVSGADDAIQSLSGADDAMQSVSGADSVQFIAA